MYTTHLCNVQFITSFLVKQVSCVSGFASCLPNPQNNLPTIAFLTVTFVEMLAIFI